VIRLERLCKHYKLRKGTIVKAVDNVDLNINPRDFALVTGRSGSGKTTLLSLISGLTKPTSGAVYIDGFDIWTLSDKKQSKLRSEKIGFIFQFPSLIPTLNVIDNLLLPTIFRKEKNREDVRDKATALLEKVGLLELAESYPEQLSIGQQKRVVISRAMMNDPELLLADEATADLDESTEKEIMEIIKRIHEDGTTVMMVTHNPELSKYASRELRMTSGILKEQSS
jgi:ABC-type lipoprotein export system ATPase subunit